MQQRIMRYFTGLMLAFYVSVACAEAGFSINSAEAVFNETTLDVSARFSLQLSESVDEALHNGVPISLVTTLDLYKVNRYLPDKRIGQWLFHKQLGYHSLTNRYVLTDPQYSESHSYASLSELFREIENFSFQSQILGETLPKSKHGYKLRLSIALDRAALPAPLRISSYVMPQWRLKSDTHEWFVEVE